MNFSCFFQAKSGYASCNFRLPPPKLKVFGCNLKAPRAFNRRMVQVPFASHLSQVESGWHLQGNPQQNFPNTILRKTLTCTAKITIPNKHSIGKKIQLYIYICKLWSNFSKLSVLNWFGGSLIFRLDPFTFFFF